MPLRYLLAFTAVIVTTTKEFLAIKGHSQGEVERIHEAWTKAAAYCLSLEPPYTKEGLW
ncbi:MAG: hypothetical protein ACREYC_07010 [Gammaproteobacteria bacterium]